MEERLIRSREDRRIREREEQLAQYMQEMRLHERETYHVSNNFCLVGTLVFKL